MTILHKDTRQGFTLIELAIVMGVVGLMTVGIWRLMSSSNQQIRDSATANQHEQLITAVKSFLTSLDGQAFMEAQCPAAPGGCSSGKIVTLPLPTSAPGTAACYAAALAGMTLQQTQTWCTNLPPGFTTSTTNPYGQTYLIQIKYATTANSTTAPTAYSFMIATYNGAAVPDSSGGRISAEIGGDGGFEYQNNVCGAPANTACGAYGAWTSPISGVSGYNFVSDPTYGHIASQSYMTSSSTATSTTGPWLARDDSTLGSPSTYSTLQNGTNIYLGGNQISSGTGAAGADKSLLYLSNTGATGGVPNSSPLTVRTVGNSTNNINPAINVQTGCTKSSTTDTACAWGIQVSGDITTTGMVWTNVAFTNSDARLKTNIHPLANALDDIMRLKPVSFTYKANGMQSLGIVAQDLEKVYPQLVSPHDDEAAMKAVNYEGLIAPLIGAVQELKHENDDLRRRLRAEEVREKELERKLDK